MQQIADRLSLNRVTVHSAVEQLLEKGLLTESREGKRRRLLAEPPELLHQILDRKEKQIASTRLEVEKLLTLLPTVPRQVIGDPEIRLYRGVDGLKKLLEETLEARDIVRVFIDIEQFVSLLSAEFLVDYYARRSALGIRSRLIWPDCLFARKIQKRQPDWNMEVRVSPNFQSARAGIFTWNNKVGIKSLADDRLTVTIIESKEISAFYRNVIFDQLWESLAEKTEHN